MKITQISAMKVHKHIPHRCASIFLWSSPCSEIPHVTIWHGNLSSFPDVTNIITHSQLLSTSPLSTKFRVIGVITLLLSQYNYRYLRDWRCMGMKIVWHPRFYPQIKKKIKACCKIYLERFRWKGHINQEKHNREAILGTLKKTLVEHNSTTPFKEKAYKI
jgi:hypothetical protein